MICIKYQNLFPEENKKNYFNMSSAEYFTQRARRLKQFSVLQMQRYLRVYMLSRS